MLCDVLRQYLQEWTFRFLRVGKKGLLPDETETLDLRNPLLNIPGDNEEVNALGHYICPTVERHRDFLPVEACFSTRRQALPATPPSRTSLPGETQRATKQASYHYCLLQKYSFAYTPRFQVSTTSPSFYLLLTAYFML